MIFTLANGDYFLILVRSEINLGTDNDPKRFRGFPK